MSPLAGGAGAGAAASSSSTTAAAPDSTAPQEWNTKNLGMRLGADVVSASCAAGLISPLIAFIDKSIMEKAFGASPSIRASLAASLACLARHPLRSTLGSRPVRLVFLLYGGTYLTANTLDTASATTAAAPARTTTAGPAKFIASSAANVSLCVYKDQAFAKLFRATTTTAASVAAAAAAAPRPVPFSCFAIFALRDCMTIFASFNVPVRLAPYIDACAAKMRLVGGGGGGGGGGAAGFQLSGLTTAQFLAPAAVQVLSTPLHLLGLDLYNRPSGSTLASTLASTSTSASGPASTVSWRERWRAIRSGWLPSCAARIARIVPAFGVGGVVNYQVRQNLMSQLE